MIQSLSVRVPWHDNGWNGCVCKNPRQNQACRVLKNIATTRANANIQQCEDAVGSTVNPSNDFIPPCLLESGQFMAEHAMTSIRKHPYTYDSHFGHIQDTLLTVLPFSFTVIPYKWTLKDKDGNNDSPNCLYATGFRPDLDVAVTSADSWITNGENQRKVFNYFYRNVIPAKSLIVAYAKAVPFVETPGRIVISIGLVQAVGELKEYDYSETPSGTKVTACLWERNIEHSIRSDRRNGFIFPFPEIQEYLKQHPEQNPDELIVIAPEEYKEEFSYAAEHLSHDALIQTLNKTISVLNRYKEIGLSYGAGADWDYCIDWCNAQLKKIWMDRGAYPGLGAVLSALGVPFGFDVALALKTKYSDDLLWANIINGLEILNLLLPADQLNILKDFSKTKREDIEDEIEEGSAYLELLSRITLSFPQAQLLLNGGVRSDKWFKKYADYLTDIHIKDLSASIIENPYLLYEKTYRLELKYQIGIGKVDLAMFPPKYLVDQFYPHGNKSGIQESDDQRRLRAIITSILESESANGSSLMLIGDVVDAVGEFRSDVPDISQDIRKKTILGDRRKPFFNEIFDQISIKTISESGNEQDDTALQLVRLKNVNEIIRSFVNTRVEQPYIDVEDDWEKLLDLVLGNEQQSDEEHEDLARTEKVEAIVKMAKSHISILTGGAGTGKTTTLVALCLSKQIQADGILVLAPTGKARVVLSSKLREQNIGHEAMTIFQVLMRTSHCDINTYSYYLSGKKGSGIAGTVIVDECSMLTEEMFGALIEAVQDAKRVVFVGDPNQLPPIGTGKPFYELVQKLKSQNGWPHYTNLVISNRQKRSSDGDMSRLDVELSKLFTEDLQGEADENLFPRIASDNENLEFVSCKDAEALPEVIKETLLKIGIADVDTFDASLGGTKENGWMNFVDAKSVDNWQILSPYHNKEVIGTQAINAFIQSSFRIPQPKTHRRTKNPLGIDGIRFGEKVINLQNQDRSTTAWAGSVWSREGLSMDACEKYLANGEIGIVRGLREKGKNIHVVQFSSQVGYEYNFYSGVTEENSLLELAYSLTVHKSQGSGFKATIFVLIEPEKGRNPLVTREMLYTALTRQTDKVFIIYNKQPSEIRKYMALEYSDLALRKTNLFGNAVLRQLKNKWFDGNLIHVTIDGTRVRSKSEVIVYNLLIDKGLHPIYERELKLGNVTIHPDFTLETTHGTIYWEHLGMLGNRGYSKDWERKRKLYLDHGYSEQNGNLVLSQDELNGSIDSNAISKLIEKYL